MLAPGRAPAPWAPGSARGWLCRIPLAASLTKLLAKASMASGRPRVMAQHTVGGLRYRPGRQRERCTSAAFDQTQREPSGSSSGVEHLLPKQRVEGSNPFSRSNFATVAVWSHRARCLDGAASPGRPASRRTRDASGSRSAHSPRACAPPGPRTFVSTSPSLASPIGTRLLSFMRWPLGEIGRGGR